MELAYFLSPIVVLGLPVGGVEHFSFTVADWCHLLLGTARDVGAQWAGYKSGSP